MLHKMKNLEVCLMKFIQWKLTKNFFVLMMNGVFFSNGIDSFAYGHFLTRDKQPSYKNGLLWQTWNQTYWRTRNLHKLWKCLIVYAPCLVNEWVNDPQNVQTKTVYNRTAYIKGELNLNFLKLAINRENCGSRNVLIPFLNLLLLKSCKRTLPLTSIPKSSFRKRICHSVLKSNLTAGFLIRLLRSFLDSFIEVSSRLWGCWVFRFSNNVVIKLLRGKRILNIFSFWGHRTSKP